MSGSVESTESPFLASPIVTTGRPERLIDRISVVPAMLAITLAVAAFSNPIQPISETRASLGNPLLLLRLAVAGLAWTMGFWGLVKSRAVRRHLMTLPGIGLLVLAASFLIASVFAPPESAMISRAAALICSGYVLLIATAASALGIGAVVRSIFAGLVLYLIVAWLTALLIPSIGQFHEYIDADTTVTRMGGVAHPNSIAKEAAVCLLIALAMMRTRVGRPERTNWDAASSRPRRYFLFGVVALALATLAATLSRTSMLALAAGSLMLFFDALWGRRGVVLSLATIMIALVGLFISVLQSERSLGQSAAAVVTKSGDVEELTSLTGRTRIWAEALDWISQRPLVGYGLDSAASVMSKESVGTHSLLLHLLFSAGVVAGGVMVLFLIKTLVIALRSREPLYRGVATFVLVAGLVEDTLFPSFPCSLTLLWMATMLTTAFPERRQPTATV